MGVQVEVGWEEGARVQVKWVGLEAMPGKTAKELEMGTQESAPLRVWVLAKTRKMAIAAATAASVG